MPFIIHQSGWTGWALGTCISTFFFLPPGIVTKRSGSTAVAMSMSLWNSADGLGGLGVGRDPRGCFDMVDI